MNTKTTEMMVEYLVSGILGLCALLFLFCCIFDEIKEKILNPDTWKYFEDNIFFTIPLFMALAYSFGIVFESISLIRLEWIHKHIKSIYFNKFKNKYNEIFFKAESKTENLLISEGTSYTNFMRYQVLKADKEFFKEIEGQHQRLRLTRVFFIIEIIIIIGLLITIARMSITGSLLIGLPGIINTISCFILIYHKFRLFTKILDIKWWIVYYSLDPMG